MNSEWQNFLLAQRAEIGAEGEVRFPAGATAANCNLFDLSHLGLIAVKGEDADTFLQGQLTNDVRELSEGHSQLAGHCSPKGRMLASFRLLRRGGEILLQLPSGIQAPIQKRLGMYVMRSKVTVSDANDRLVCIGLAGECAEELLTAAVGGCPEPENGVESHGELTMIRMPGAIPRFQAIGPVQPVADLWTRLADHAVPANPDDWALLEIRAGVPTVLPQTVESFVPQMANMQLVDGVSFNKGCYTGQEVVARMQYLGKLKRRMYRAQVESPHRPAPGEALYSGTSTSGQGAGRVVDASPIGDDRYELLAVAEIAAMEQGDLHLGADGPRLEFLDLPYAFPETEHKPQ